MKQGLSLEQIAEATKISMRFLRAIEAENFEEVPGGIYLRSYLRQYAVAVGCNPGELLEAAGCEVTDEVRGGRKSEKWPEGSRVPLGKLGNTP
jgi:cytoskeletal protein RodZ